MRHSLWFLRAVFRKLPSLVGVLLALGLFFPERVLAEQGSKAKRLELRAGYGYQYTNESRPNNFQVISLLPSLSVPLTGPVGPSFGKGRFEWSPELIAAFFIHPYLRPMLGATPLQFSYALEPKGRFLPYLFAGTGILWANVNRRESRSDLNFNIQGGVGTRYRVSERTSLILEYRHMHISNAGLHEDNAGLNTHTFLVGVSLSESEKK